LKGTAQEPLSAADRCYQAVAYTPLELLARAALQLNLDSDAIRATFERYDDFLALLSDEDKRRRLKRLTFEESGEEEVFQEVRALGHKFQAALDDVFVNKPSVVSELILKYGIF
jgi:hypothetical protein